MAEGVLVIFERRGYLAGLLRPWAIQCRLRVVEARTVGDCLRAVSDHGACLILYDASELSLDVADAVAQLHVASPDSRVIVLYHEAAPQSELAVRESGAASALRQPLSRRQLLEVLGTRGNAPPLGEPPII